MRRQREMMYLVGGLIVGFIIGALVIGAADVDLFGTAGEDNDGGDNNLAEVDKEYYLVSLEELETWLAEGEGDNPLAGLEGLTAAGDITTLDQASTGFLSDVYVRLAGEDGNENLGVCLALNNDPYGATGQPLLYVYLQVPTDMVDELPETFTDDESNKIDPIEGEGSLVWSINCYDPNAES